MILVLSTMKLFCSLVLLLLLQGIVNGNTNSTSSRASLDVQRSAQEVTCFDSAPKYSIYNNSTNQFDIIYLCTSNSFDYPKARILLDQYPSSKINITVNQIICPSNIIQCVKIKFGTIQTIYKKAPPYESYSDNTIIISKPRTPAWQSLEAWTYYNNSNCLGNANMYTRIDVQLVPKTIGIVRIGPLPVIYNRTISSSVSIQQTAAIVKATCDSIHQSFSGSLFKTGTGLEKFKCWRVTTTTNTSTTTPTTALVPTLSITYKFILTFRMYGSCTPFYNPDLPNSTQVTDNIKLLFRDVNYVGPGEVMSQYIKRTIKSSNPYYPYTNIIV